MFRQLPGRCFNAVYPLSTPPSLYLSCSRLSCYLSPRPQRDNISLKNGEIYNTLPLCPHRRPHSRPIRLLSRFHRRYHSPAQFPLTLLSLHSPPFRTSINTSTNHNFLARGRIIRRPARNAFLLEIWTEGMFVSCRGVVCLWCGDAVA
jgi:hypothetical protein